MKYLVTRTPQGNYDYSSITCDESGQISEHDFIGMYFLDEDAWVTVRSYPNILCTPAWLAPGSSAIIEGDSPTNYEILKEL